MTTQQLTPDEQEFYNDVVACEGYEVPKDHLIAKALIKKGLIQQVSGPRGPGGDWIRIEAIGEETDGLD